MLYSVGLLTQDFFFAGDRGKMASQPVKGGLQCGLSLKQEPPPKRCEEIPTDYTKCILCRGRDVKGLNNILAKTKDRLLVAKTAQQDEIFTRLHLDVASDTVWLTDNLPK